MLDLTYSQLDQNLEGFYQKNLKVKMEELLTKLGDSPTQESEGSLLTYSEYVLEYHDIYLEDIQDEMPDVTKREVRNLYFQEYLEYLSFETDRHVTEDNYLEVIQRRQRDVQKRKTKYDYTSLSLPELKINQKIVLATIHWYFPEEIRWLTNLWLTENWGAEHREIRDVLLISKDFALGYLLIQDRFNNHDFFGNMLNKQFAKILSSNYFDFKKTSLSKVERYTGYCRGYSESSNWSPHQPLKGLRKKLLSQSEVEDKLNLELDRFLVLVRYISQELKYYQEASQ